MQETSEKESDALTALLAILLATDRDALDWHRHVVGHRIGAVLCFGYSFCGDVWVVLPAGRSGSRAAAVDDGGWPATLSSRAGLGDDCLAWPQCSLAVVGPKEEGDWQLWAVGYTIATLLAATASLKMIDALKRERGLVNVVVQSGGSGHSWERCGV